MYVVVVWRDMNVSVDGGDTLEVSDSASNSAEQSGYCDDVWILVLQIGEMRGQGTSMTSHDDVPEVG